MSTNEALHGLSCPRCGGMVPIPEGQVIVICPYCDLRSTVQGEHGVNRYQVPCRVQHEQALQAFQRFLSGNMAIAGSARREAKLSEAFLLHLPFWTVWGQGLAWAFGQEQVGSGDDKHYEPREVKAIEELNWNTAACDVGEFGVNMLSLAGRQLEVFDAEALHRSGMVFEPVGSAEEALQAARADFEQRMREKTKLDRLEQQFVRVVRPKLGLVYYPMWVMRYLYRGRSFQVVVDGFSGEVLYGKAPGNTLYRAAVLVGGMAAGAFTSIDLPLLILSGKDNDGGEIAAILFVVGLGMMYFAYHTFRYGEHYEYRRYTASDQTAAGAFKFASKALDQINRFK